jgi:hypothetical protein
VKAVLPYCVLLNGLDSVLRLSARPAGYQAAISPLNPPLWRVRWTAAAGGGELLPIKDTAADRDALNLRAAGVVGCSDLLEIGCRGHTELQEGLFATEGTSALSARYMAIQSYRI